MFSLGGFLVTFVLAGTVGFAVILWRLVNEKGSDRNDLLTRSIYAETLNESDRIYRVVKTPTNHEYELYIVKKGLEEDFLLQSASDGSLHQLTKDIIEREFVHVLLDSEDESSGSEDETASSNTEDEANGSSCSDNEHDEGVNNVAVLQVSQDTPLPTTVSDVARMKSRITPKKKVTTRGKNLTLIT